MPVEGGRRINTSIGSMWGQCQAGAMQQVVVTVGLRSSYGGRNLKRDAAGVCHCLVEVAMSTEDIGVELLRRTLFLTSSTHLLTVSIKHVL